MASALRIALRVGHITPDRHVLRLPGQAHGVGKGIPGQRIAGCSDGAQRDAVLRTIDKFDKVGEQGVREFQVVTGLPVKWYADRDKLVGLTIDPMRLSRIRQERRPNSRYASLARCQAEVRQAEQIFQRLRLKEVLDTTTHSIEEVSSRIMKRF